MRSKLLILGAVMLALVLPATLAPAASAAPLDRFPHPALYSVSPDSGPTSGGTSVVLTGADFDVRAVLFGGVAANFTIVSGTEIIATSPAESAGTVYVQVVAQNGSVFGDIGFTYS